MPTVELIHGTVKASTLRSVLDRAIKGGINHPHEWCGSRDGDMNAIKDRWAGTPAGEWPRCGGYGEALDYIRARLLTVEEKLRPELAVAKLQRLRPELLAVPVELDDAAIRRLLKAMTWAVAEDQGTRNTKPAVRALAEYATGKAPSPSALQEFSEALLDDVDGAEELFFAAFDAPPYWRHGNGAFQLTARPGRTWTTRTTMTTSEHLCVGETCR